jgi:lysine N6-hydroxylase
MENELIYDIIGIGIGPFNLGLAALCYNIPELNCLFIDQSESFNWHPGMLLPWARLQVPFYADLVTLADPQSRFSYLSFLKAKHRMFRFAIREDYFIKRTEFNDYCQWVAAQLPSLKFNSRCKEVSFINHKNCYEIKTDSNTFLAKHIVIGIGTIPHIPSFSNNINHPLLLHSGDYLFRKEQLLKQEKIALIGSGQSAAEIFYDLLQCYEGEITWFTRADSFFPMDYSKFNIEKTSPDYIDYFYSLNPEIKKKILCNQNHLYKGINASLISAIYDLLDDKKPKRILLHPNCEWKGIAGYFDLCFQHRELQQEFNHKADAVIMATGYRNSMPGFISPIQKRIQWNNNDQYAVNRNYSIDKHNSVFVQNAELHSHGFNAPDLGMGPYRNSIILNSILGYEHFVMEKGIAFQSFGIPENP